MKTRDYFENNGYVVLSDALNKKQCEELTQHMFDLHDQGKLIKDNQCPESDAIYGDPVFDKLLADFAAPIGNQVGRQLIPTYTYARIYRPGEILKKHKDRPSCEISATLTLGFDGKNIWPIYFDDQKETMVTLDVGEMAVYKGTEICHWRKPFKGNWHVQVFLHYVDANGPHKDHAFDGRNNLGVDKENRKVSNNLHNQNTELPETFMKPIHDGMIIPSNDNELPGYFCIDSNTFSDLKFTEQECEEIIRSVEESYPSTASIGDGERGGINRKIRSADIFNITNDEQHRWIWDKVGAAISVVNKVHFDYEISGINHSLQLIRYDSEEDVKGHYDWHIDAGPGCSSTRKISLTTQLSDPNTYDGCELHVGNHGHLVTASNERGSIHLFPSYMPHRVTPIEKGVRYALVIWVHGSRRFR